MAVEFVGSALLSALLEVAFDRLASAEIGDYFGGRKLNEKLLNKLNIMLLSINSLVDDAEQKQIKDRKVRAWLGKVKDAVFDTEDLLDEIGTQVSQWELGAESQTSISKVRNLSNASVTLFDNEIESKMQEILDNLEYLASQKDILGLEKASGFGVGSRRQVSPKLPSTSLPDESVIYGRDVDKEIIFNCMISDPQNSNQLSIISIVGMGGMGKTTLAQHFYNDPRMEGEFDIKAWVCVSDEFDVFKVTRTILVAITKSTDDSIDLNMLQVKLKEKLMAKKFLLVLDDVWNENHMQWKALQTPFNHGAQGSKILVTTRSMKVASIMRSTKIHQLEQLQGDHCWQLFAKHAFQDENHQLNPQFKEIALKIIEKCKGLPLALKTIGSLLYTKSSILEWESILKSEIWDLPEEDSNIIPALMLSYYHLPSHLKSCFAYCSLFPKDFVFEKEQLILLWMAENFLQCHQHSKSMEEVGEQYFDDLLSRCFFQQSNGDEMHFIMHDLLNDLAKYVSGDFCFTLQVEEAFCFTLQVKEAQNILKMTRHFSLLRNRYEGSKKFETLYRANRLRTFLPLSMNSHETIWDHWMPSTLRHGLFSKFKYLRVLSMSSYSNVFELPNTIGNLKHLRYLDLSHTDITELPDSTCLLYNLQVLKLKYCRSLVELPLNLHKLINLHYLDFSGTKVRKMPMHFEKLKNLQVLSSFYVGKNNESSIQHLRELSLHGTLSISELQNIVNPLDALAANLKSKIHLVKLELEWSANHDDSQKEREVLEMLQPSKHLKELSIKAYGGTRFPDWFGDNSLSNMVSLKLSKCENCVLLPPLGLLPFLKELSVVGLPGIVVIGIEFYGNGSSSSSTIPFASLETLEFKDMEGWEEWECKIVRGSFPCLRELSIKNCPKLKDHLPERLPYLKKLRIYDCKQLVASIPLAPSIVELNLYNYGKLQLDYHPSTLKSVSIGGHYMKEPILEGIRHTLFNSTIERLEITDFPTMNITISHCYNFLETLKIKGSCDSLRNFPLDIFPKLCSLHLEGLSNFEMISQEHGHNLTPLTNLSIISCPKFVSFPRGGLSAPKLQRFAIKILENLRSLPECMQILLPYLNFLEIYGCPQIESFSDGGLPPNLKYLHLRNCSKLLIASLSLKCVLATTTSLHYLGMENLDVKSFPDEGLLPHSLAYLSIRNCPDLNILDYKGLFHLSSLTYLQLMDCPKLQCLPEEGLPKSISTLTIQGSCSSSLKRRCQKPKGEDWGKISHIQCIRIDNDLIT